MNWNVDPEIFRIGSFAVRYYSLMFVIGFFTMGHYIGTLFEKEAKDPQDVSSLTTFVIVGMVVGARLGHCLFYEPGYYFQNPLQILYVWQGGLASHGGYLGVIIAVYLFLKKHPNHSFFKLLDCLSGPSLFVGGLIRIGNLMNSEIYGRPTDLPWAFVFERVDQIPRHPAQLYESIGYFIISFILIYLYRAKSNVWKDGKILSIAMILSFSFRFFIEFTKDEQSTVFHQPVINMGQWLSLAFVALGIVLYFLLPQKKSHHL